ncbi:MAG: glycosyltransferase family 4 protein [Acidimicrobiales bacterium]
MRINQIVVSAAPGDEVTESALTMARALRGAGVSSDVYAARRDSGLTQPVRRLDEYVTGDGNDLLIYHADVGDHRVVDFLLRSTEQLLVAYHGIAPARYYDEFDADSAARLRFDRSSLRRLGYRAIGALAYSSFAANELRELGLSNVEVVPPGLDRHRLLDAGADETLVAQLAESTGPLVLCVDELLPHARPDLAIAAHHMLNVNYVPDARLVLAGTPRNSQFASALTRHVHSLNLPSVSMTGAVNDAQLATFYRSADVLVVPSEYEASGSHIMAAFHFGVPVVARDFGAIREVAQGAAIVLGRDAGAPEMCEAIARVLRDVPLRVELRRRGHQVAAAVRPERTLTATLVALARVVAHASTPDHSPVH